MLSRRALRALSWAPFVESVPVTATARHRCPFSVFTPCTSSACHNGALPSQTRHSSSSSKRWQTRQGRDRFAKEAKVQGLKSRAAFKLLEINERYKIFKKGQTVVDLGYAPGSWSQVAVDLTQPRGRILGIDIIPAQPPRGVSTIQGNFLSPLVQEEVKRFLLDPDRGRPRAPTVFSDDAASDDVDDLPDQQLAERGLSYLELERRATHDADPAEQAAAKKSTKRDKELELGHTVDVLLSDMCAPWPLTDGLWKQSLSRPYYRMVNTSGIGFKDHAGSMDLCHSALAFGYDTLKIGGSFVCKFYMGGEDKALEARLKRLFRSVYREKPESSRSESREAYFVALRRRDGVKREDVVGEL